MLFCCVTHVHRLRSIWVRSVGFTRCLRVQYFASRAQTLTLRCVWSAVMSSHETRCRSWRAAQSGRRCFHTLTTQPHFNRSMCTVTSLDQELISCQCSSSCYCSCCCVMTMPARQSGTRCLMNLEILTVLIVLNGSWKQFSLATSSVSSTSVH